jgi:competence ComEA-like helix-hairpin-helix protein
MELQRKIQFNFVMLTVCLCILSSLATYIIIKSQPTITQSQNVYINKNPEKEKVNINTATFEELEMLPIIGNKKAKDIIKNRPYHNIYDIAKIKGIGKDSIPKLENIITCGEVN